MLRLGCSCLTFVFTFLVFPIIGVIALYVYGQVTTITCAHIDGQVDCVKQVTWLDLWPIPPDEILPRVTGARAEVDCRSWGRSRVECYANELVIENAERSFRIGSPYFNEDTAAEASTRINDYIRQPGPAAPLVIPCRNNTFTTFTMAFVGLLWGCYGVMLWSIYAKKPIKVFKWQIGQ